MDFDFLKGISPQDFPNICRICLSKDSTLKPFVQLHLLNIFKNTTNIEIEPTDNLPKNICDRCLNRLEDICSFINLSKRSDANLQLILKRKESNYCFEHAISESSALDDASELSDKLETESVKKENIPPGNMEKVETYIVLQSGIEGDKISTRHSTKKQPSSCEICGENFSTKGKLIEHQKKNSNCRIRHYKCTMCDKAFYTKFKLNMHMRSHTKETPFECKICFKKFTFPSNLKRHDDVAHKGLKPFKCDVCGKKFARNSNLVEHKRDHSGEIPFICSYCGLSFKKTSTYHYHLNIHQASNSKSKSEDLICNICSKVFGSKTTLKNHKITHTKENNFLCHICGKNFTTKQTLGNHIRVHLGVKPFCCRFCGKTFSRKSTLDVHILHHTKEKPFTCKTCLKTFAQLIHLKNHERIHNGEKPYRCTYCNKKFPVKCNLVIHKRVHTNDITYKCTVCEKMYYESRSLKKHMKVHQNSSLVVLTNEDITTLLA